MSLREDIANRLTEVQLAESQRILAEQGIHDRIPARVFLGVRLVIADEVIRQMEWARTYCYEDERFVTLTAAPEGWTPDA